MDIITIRNLTKKYAVTKPKISALSKIFQWESGHITALSDVNLTIKKNEIVCLLGYNGSGKTTLLKIIAGLTQPTSGTIVTSGRVIPLIDLYSGFYTDLSGVENILINGVALGMTKREIAGKFSSIIEFAGLNNYIDLPIRTYSSGMMLKLAFSIAINAYPDILIVDEVLAVGDAVFKEICIRKICKMVLKGMTLIYTSHNFKAIENLKPDKVVWLEKGRVKKTGAYGLVNEYAKVSHQMFDTRFTVKNGRYTNNQHFTV